MGVPNRKSIRRYFAEFPIFRSFTILIYIFSQISEFLFSPNGKLGNFKRAWNNMHYLHTLFPRKFQPKFFLAPETWKTVATESWNDLFNFTLAFTTSSLPMAAFVFRLFNFCCQRRGRLQWLSGRRLFGGPIQFVPFSIWPFYVKIFLEMFPFQNVSTKVSIVNSLKTFARTSSSCDACAVRAQKLANVSDLKHKIKYKKVRQKKDW